MTSSISPAHLIRVARLQTGLPATASLSDVAQATVQQTAAVLRACAEEEPSLRLTFGNPTFWQAVDSAVSSPRKQESSAGV